MHLTSLSPLGTSASLELQAFGLPIRCGRKRMSFQPMGLTSSFCLDHTTIHPFCQVFLFELPHFCKLDSKRECCLGGSSSPALYPRKELENHAVEHGGVGCRRPAPPKAITNILAPTPMDQPPALEFQRRETTALANPVMGTSVPAPCAWPAYRTAQAR